jgi:pyruvate,water dikinase
MDFCISDETVLEIAKHAIAIEEHYSRAAGAATPLDIEWAQNGPGGNIYVVQARPETVASRRPDQALETFTLKENGRVLVTGRAVGEKIAAGCTRVVENARDLAAFRPAEVLVRCSLGLRPSLRVLIDPSAAVAVFMTGLPVPCCGGVALTPQR